MICEIRIRAPFLCVLYDLIRLILTILKLGSYPYPTIVVNHPDVLPILQCYRAWINFILMYYGFINVSCFLADDVILTAQCVFDTGKKRNQYLEG